MTEVCPSLPKTKGQKPFMVVTKNSVKSNTTTTTSVLKSSSPTKTKNVLSRRKATNQKNNNQTSSTGSEILMNDQPKSPIKKKNTTTTINKTNKKVISDNTEIRDIPRVQKLGKSQLSHSSKRKGLCLMKCSSKMLFLKRYGKSLKCFAGICLKQYF